MPPSNTAVMSARVSSAWLVDCPPSVKLAAQVTKALGPEAVLPGSALKSASAYTRTGHHHYVVGTF